MKKNRELYLRYRPKKLSKVLGQDAAVYSLETLAKKKKIAHALLLSGPSGCGKTTIARIVASIVGCKGSDLNEVNSADFRGIDTIRDIRSRIGLSALEGDSRVWIIDEAHQLSTQAQQAFLKLLEDMPEHVYFMLCTTESNKIIKAIRTRCSEIKVKSIDNETMLKLLNSVLKKEKEEVHKSVREKIIEVADGSARKALVLLHQVIGMENKKKQIQVILDADTEKQAIEIARALIRQGTQWKEIAILIKGVEEEPESIRRMILGYASAIALGGGGPVLHKAMILIDCFSSNYYDCGKAGLIWSCNQALNIFNKPRK